MRKARSDKRDQLPPGVNKDPNDIPNCDCGYSRSDWMIGHDDDCAYVQHGEYHKLEKTYFNPMAD